MYLLISISNSIVENDKIRRACRNKVHSNIFCFSNENWRPFWISDPFNTVNFVDDYPNIIQFEFSAMTKYHGHGIDRSKTR